MNDNQTSFEIRFRTEIEGTTWIEDYFVENAFVQVYNHMCDITNEGAIDEFNRVFERYYPNECGCNSDLDNAYSELSFRMSKEIADKFSPIYGVLPTGRCVYLDPREPVTFKPDEGVGRLKGYVK